MRELEALEGRCARCGADAWLARAYGASGGTARGHAARATAFIFTREARTRSGLAYAAGFAGLFYLFWPSAAALAWEWLGMSSGLVALAWGLSAPLAMALGLAAARELDRAPWKVGRAQAVLGYLLGFFGTIALTLFLLAR
jgi:hypothetical protein